MKFATARDANADVELGHTPGLHSIDATPNMQEHQQQHVPAPVQEQPLQHQAIAQSAGALYRPPHGQYLPRREPNYGRVIKTFKIEPFSASIDQGAIDSGVATWFKRFEALLSMQEDLHLVRLPESMKNALLFQHLSGAASQWYISDCHDLRDRSLSSLGRPKDSKLSKAQIGQMVANEKKKTSETYREYSLHLRDMAASTTSDGIETAKSNNLALSSFVASAWRKHSDNLRMVIRRDTHYPVHDMDRAISRLCTIAGHQGVLAFQQRQSMQLKPAPVSAKSNLGKRKSDEVGRSEGKFSRCDFSTARCGICGELGHSTGYPDKFVALQSSGMASVARSSEANQASNQLNGGDDEQKRTEPNSFD
ncbi:hypothetical protein PC129_g12885 [Phytophthora cactorum]|uniref:Uncharacterized protein n=2 Tax=Phytophthora cactorum TaxID=29920 RepID=A0A8T1HW76_9STRA|nr:hypothetical protein Pcac1_g22805 [Phytophthora cactorum]KAG2813885.1 hypothetical protein PC112_g14558 [Phytophthora cactorum]KAG2815588.1 hypothetical protein PC111_g13507 [Phytophthora cactorum]KAG2894505.1 hypothetical protein PC114_g15880 [Phytophthora cactorum]KAG2925322.1 hypothetical protein PC117_g15196 [Phytophthora cactorum]